MRLFQRGSLLCSLLCALLLPASGAIAQKVVMYRCTDAAGALTVQNDVPCPKGSKQDRRVIVSVPVASAPRASVPIAPAARPTTPAATLPTPAFAATVQPVAAASAIADGDRLPPPVLFECRTYDNDRYLSDDGLPPERCAPLTTNGIGGGSPGAGESCEMVTDKCQRIADGALCESWKTRLLEAQAALRFGRRDHRETAQSEVDRIASVVRESTCGM